MIKKFNEYINEDYFSKLANRKDNGNVRIENEITEDFVRSFVEQGYEHYALVTLRKENDKTIVDIDGSFYLRDDAEEIPFQFGTVTGMFNCFRCTKLKSLKGFPKKVGGNLVIDYCENVKSLNGCPEEVGGDFMCRYFGKKFTKEYVKSLCNVKGDIFV